MFVSFGTVAIFQRIAQSIHDSLQLCGVEAQQVHVFVFGPDANTHTGCDVDVHVRTLATIQFTQIRAYFRFTRQNEAAGAADAAAWVISAVVDFQLR